MPGLQMRVDARPIRRGLLDANARQMMARRHVTGALIGVASSGNPAVDSAHRRRHWTFLSRAGHRKRSAEGQGELQILGETLPPAGCSGIALAVANHVDAVGIAGGEIGELDAIRLGRRSSMVCAESKYRCNGQQAEIS